MRKKNGITIIEILISIIIIAIVMGLLFTLLIQVRNEDTSNQIQSNFVINQATIIKEVQEDIVNYGVKSISKCTLGEANISNSVLNQGHESKFKCIKIEYEANYISDNIGFLMLYNTYARYDVENGEYKGQSDSARWMIQYIRGNYTKYQTASGRPVLTSWKNATQIMKDYPADINTNDGAYVSYRIASGAWNAASIVIPIVNGDGEHYDINLGFTFYGENNFKCRSDDKNKLDCRCDGVTQLCQKTYQ